MYGFLKPFVFFMIFLAASTLASARWAGGQTTFYKYVDRNGTVHFTDNLESIPQGYRNQIEVMKERTPPETGPSPGERAGKVGQARETKRAEESEALRRKEAKREEIEARETKEKRIAELQAQIQALQEERGSLRTIWMVYDRIKLNRLNEEIAAREEEIESLRKELPEEK
jgi:hypothetical protein